MRNRTLHRVFAKMFAFYRMEMFSTMALIVATLLSCSRTVTGQQSAEVEVVTIPYQILPLSVQMTVNDKGFEIDSFQSRFEGIMALHLTNHFLKSLPARSITDEPFTKEIFDKVELRTRLAKTYVGAPGGESRIEAAITGAAYFNFAQASDAPLGNATFTRQVMTTTTLEAFQGNEYLKMLDLYMDDDILREVTGMEITVENTLIAGGGFFDPLAQDDSNNRNVAAIAASILCVGFTGTALIIVFLVQKKKKRKRSGKSRKGEGDTQSPDGSPEAAAGEERAESGDGDADDFMDEWTQKITSIPLRLAGKMAKPKPQSRPATRQSRKVWLFCIAEEDDVVEGEPRVLTEEKDEDDDEDDVELAENPSGRNEQNQFDDVDLAAPADYEARLESHRVLL